MPAGAATQRVGNAATNASADPVCGLADARDLAHFRHHVRAVRWIEAQDLDDWERVLSLEYLRDSYEEMGVPADARAALVRAHACALLAIKVDGVWPFPELVFGARYARPEPWAAAPPIAPPVLDDELSKTERKLFQAIRHTLLRETLDRSSRSFSWYSVMLRLPRGAGGASTLRRAAGDMRRGRRPTSVSADMIARVFAASEDIDVPLMAHARGWLPWLFVGAGVEYLGAEGYERASVEAVSFDGRAHGAAVWLVHGGRARLRWTTADRLRPALPAPSDSRALRALD